MVLLGFIVGLRRICIGSLLFSLFLVGFLSNPLVFASSVMWNQTYEGTAQSLIETSDGGFAFAGSIQPSDVGGTDFWLVKTDAYGNMEWNQTWDGSELDHGSSLVEMSDGGFLFAGHTNVAGHYDIWLFKTDSSGNMVWNQTYEGVVSSLIKSSDGGYVLTGDGHMIKIDEDGNMEWNQTHGGTSLIETSDGGFAYSGAGGSGQLVKTDANGNIQWSRSYGGANYDSLHSLVLTSDGGYALVGETNSFSDGMADAWLVKTDANGNMEWYKTYGGTNYEYPASLVETSDGGFVFAGVTFSYGGGNSDFWLVKTDEVGNIEWNQTYGETGYEFAHSLVETSDGSFALAGTKSSFGAWLVKTVNQSLIPEFPSWTPMLLIFIVLAVAIAIYKRRLRPQTNQQFREGC